MVAALSLVLTASSWAAPPPGEDSLLFSRISAADGISHTAVIKIIQDSHGFIWIGTQQGLNRFDGYEFEEYHFLPDDPQSLSSEWIYDIFEDRSGQIWVATDGGLDLFEPQSKTFRHNRHIPGDPASGAGIWSEPSLDDRSTEQPAFHPKQSVCDGRMLTRLLSTDDEIPATVEKIMMVSPSPDLHFWSERPQIQNREWSAGRRLTV